MVGFIASGTSRTKEVLKMSSPLPTVSYSSTQAIMENITQFPWLVRMFPSDSQRAEATTQMLRNYGWKKMFMIVDQASTWANSLAKSITDKSSNYGIVLENWWTPHLRNMSKLNATRLDLLEAAKLARSKGYKVIVLSMSKYVELAVRALYDEGLYGEGIVIIGSVDSFFVRTKAAFSGPERTVLDASMALVESGVDRGVKHSIETMAAWPEGADSFLTSAHMSRTAYAIDGLQLLAHAIDATISRDKSPFIASEIMSSLRTTAVQGLTGEVKIETNWNNIRSRSYTITMSRVLHGHNTVVGRLSGENNNTGTSIAMEKLGVVYTDKADMRVCENGDPPAIGSACEGGAAPVVNVQAFGKSNTTMEVRWVAAPASTSESLKSGVRVSLSSSDPDEIDIVDTVPSGRTNMIFGLDKLKVNVHYSVRVTALYDDGQVQAFPTDCRDTSSCGGSLACIPDNTATRTCECKDNELHTMGLVGVLPEAWGCHQCRSGLKCQGGTTETTFTAKGWFVGNTRHLTVAEPNEAGNKTEQIFPSLMKCPKDGACPGGFQVSKLLEAGADLDVIFAQCEEGFTGFQCAACRQGYTYTSCVKCTIPQDGAIAIAFGLGLFILGLFIIGYIVVKRARRRPLLERRFVGAFEKAERKFGIGGSLRAFTDVFGCSAESGVSHSKFMRALKPGGKLESVTAKSSRGKRRWWHQGGSIDGAAMQTLWEKLDKDGDGIITGSEFLVWFYRLKSGKGSMNPIRARFARLGDWYFSIKTQTLKVVLVTYFQLLSSIPRSFPLVARAGTSSKGSESPAEASATSASTQAAQGYNSTEPTKQAGPMDLMMAAFQPVLDALGNFNVQVIDTIQCIVGPRYIDRLTFTATLIIGSIGTAWAIVGILHVCACVCRSPNSSKTAIRSRLADNARVAVLSASSVASTVSIQVLFLLYPLSCAFILRTWACDAYNVNGETRSFMADDKYVECTPWFAFDSPYGKVASAAAVFLVIVVLGMPALQYWLLRRWKKPFNRLFVSTVR